MNRFARSLSNSVRESKAYPYRHKSPRISAAEYARIGVHNERNSGSQLYMTFERPPDITTVTISEYGDSYSFSDIGFKTALDESVKAIESTMASNMAQSLDALVSLTAGTVTQPDAFVEPDGTVKVQYYPF